MIYMNIIVSFISLVYVTNIFIAKTFTRCNRSATCFAHVIYETDVMCTEFIEKKKILLSILNLYARLPKNVVPEASDSSLARLLLADIKVNAR